MQPLAGDTLDVAVVRPGALFELQPAPFRIEVVARAVQALELDEQFARTILGIDRTGAGPKHGTPQCRQREQHELTSGAQACLCATRSTALRERTLVATSAGPARSLRPMRLNGGVRPAGMTGSLASAGSSSDLLAMNCFTR